jgi:hypothetical protein
MSKLSEPLKALINASHARPGTVRAPRNIRAVYSRIAESAAAQNIGLPAWLTLSTAATMTMNSPESLLELFHLARNADPAITPLHTAELMREVGLKCISFNGIPRTINSLGAFRDGLPEEVARQLSTKPSRRLNPSNVEAVVDRGRALWKSVYLPFEDKLVEKLARSHPDLPVFIIESEYGPLLADPPSHQTDGTKVGRVLTSILAVACLRAQTGVGPQVISHVYGLRKAYEDGTHASTGEQEVRGGQWLASDEGNMWILERVDEIVDAIGERLGTSFAPGFKAKL